MARSFIICCLVLLTMAGQTMAQSQVGGPFVIKMSKVENGQTVIHYLSHAGNTISDATSFSPDCIWISDQTFTQGGTNKNYYFYDGTNYRFLAAPEFHEGGALTLSTSLPTVTDLNNPEYKYYFYRWDNGLGRGVQYFGVNAETCEHAWEYNECWEVYWVEYNEEAGTWKLSEESYGITPNGGKYSAVTITEHDQDTTISAGGLADLSDFVMVYQSSPLTEHSLAASLGLPFTYSYTPEYTTYTFDNAPHNYYGDIDHGATAPTQVNGNGASVSSYRWSITGDGASYLSFNSGSDMSTSSDETPTLYYRTENTTGDKTATLTLTVTYSDGSKQTRTATVTVKTSCQNPGQAAAPEVTYVGVTVSWYPTADSYVVSWKKTTDTDWRSATVGDVTSYTITGLEFGTTYNYKVKATCDEDDPQDYPFTTKAEPDGLMIFGAVFGGGRMADVDGKTEVVIINCDSVGTIFGGNDIAGTVVGNDGSSITLGVNQGGTYASYGTTNANKTLRLGSVYGGGNGYYSYGTTDFEPIEPTSTTATIVGAASVYALSLTNEWDDAVWTNPSSSESATLTIPSIKKTAITVTDNYVKADSIFGGAKNAFLTASSGNGSSVTINGGTIFAVFGGNNVGGSQGAGKQHVEVTKTTTNLVSSIVNTATTGYGCDFGIRYLFGGGNKVKASTTDVVITGGQLDTIFAGGNAADVATAANLTLNCDIAAGSSPIYGNLYSNAIQTYSDGVITPKSDYAWNGFTGIYNVRTLFGGNNKAAMNVVPNLTLTSGSVGTIYGGGNAGDMNAHINGTITFPNDTELDDFVFDYSTYVELNSPKMLVDYLYGGCQISSVLYSTWVELRKGHVGNVYGGCNISGDVGSTRVYPTYPSGGTYPANLEEQKVYGATYVKAGGANDDNIIVYKNLYAGSNGYYNCSTDGVTYNNDTYFDDPTGQYAGLLVPTHNETHAIISKGALVKGDVYAGGNMACVGFDDYTGFYRGFPELVGMASVRMDGGTVNCNVYGGGNMANIYGTNEVRVSSGTIGLALYGGNDHSGQVAEKTNRVLPDIYKVASDGHTSLEDLGVKTYVSVKGNPEIGTVYGGGNGDYLPGSVDYCYEDFQPIQSYTFVDIHMDGGPEGPQSGHIRTVYGGGNGVTARHGVTVFLNNFEPSGTYAYDNVDTIFGGNNKGDLDVVADILLVHGHVGTVYGGCNRGAMAAEGTNTKLVGDYDNIGSYVRLLKTYDPDGTGTYTQNVNAQVSKAIYGGCRMNGVHNNSLVLVDAGNFTGVGIFGGSDISGHVGGFSRVATTGGVVGNVYGGGNGYYTYDNGNVYTIPASGQPQLVATGITDAPSCANSGADILGGRVGTDGVFSGNVFGGGYGQGTVTTGDVVVNVGRIEATSFNDTPLIYGDIYGGSAFGNVNTEASNANPYTTTVSFLNGTLKKTTIGNVDFGGNLYGGGLGRKANQDSGITAVEAKVFGKVFVTISTEDQLENKCFIDLRNANIFGCNNANGSPQDDVRVDVWKTAFNYGDYATGDNYTSQDGQDPYYAIDQVFGGGNQADYAPQNGAVDSQKKTWVYVHNCLNTIRRVFSGGNAAAATGVKTTIEGGRMDYVFGGGNGEVSAANIGTGGTDLLVSAGIISHLFGGSNQTGDITGPVNTVVNGDNIVAAGEGVDNPCNEAITEFYGGSNLAELSGATINTLVECGAGSFTEVYGGSKQATITGNVNLTMRGGTCNEVYGGSKGTSSIAADIKDYESGTGAGGNVTLYLEGGAIIDAFGGSNVKGNIEGNIIVNVVDFEGDCGLDLTNVYGGGNLTPYTPNNATIKPIVNVMHIHQDEGIKGNVFGGAKGSTATVTANPLVNIGYNAATMSSYVPVADLPEGLTTDDFRAFVTGSVFGGGDMAAVTGNTKINIYRGEIVHKVVGGGNQASISGNTEVNITGGNICTESNPTTDVTLAGVYGGCNTSGNVGGNVTINIDGSSATPTTIGTMAALQAVAAVDKNPISVHGGGYGDQTTTNGNVTVNFGTDVVGNNSTHNPYLTLYGDMYGGSALGTVNNESTDRTTVTILNGTVQYYMRGDNQYGGNIYGGGLGNDTYAATVYGEVHVNIGAEPSTGVLIGKASLKNCNIFGCNNSNGSPQYQVYVDVYQTVHTVTDSVQYQGGDFAIGTVYGGGNRANYAPENQTSDNSLKTHNYIHYCENTIGTVYGGGRAAAADGVVTNVDGGRFEYIFGGGNGQVTPADIGWGGIELTVCSGHVGYKYVGCDMGGTVLGELHDKECNPEESVCLDDLVVDYFFFGANKATIIGGLRDTIFCDVEGGVDPMHYVNVYAGSRLATIYGDIYIVVRGGDITNLFGGSQGSIDRPGHVRKYPHADNPDEMALVPEDAVEDMRAFLAAHQGEGLEGTGGNIYMKLEGGTIRNVYGGNQLYGDIDGDIIIEVNSLYDNCLLSIDTLYGGNQMAVYHPDLVNGEPRVSPQVYVKHGKINYDVFGGSLGDQRHLYENAGQVTSHPYVLIGGDESDDQPIVGRDVFGGGSMADVIGDTKVVLRGNALVEGNVFGGAKHGTIEGTTDVKIAPETSITPVIPTPPAPEYYTLNYAAYPPEGGTIEVTDSHGRVVENGAQVASGTMLHIVARSNSGYTFSQWYADHGVVVDPGEYNTSFIMGPFDCTLRAVFEP